MSAFLLQMSGISKRFGATQALHDVSLSLHTGRVCALIGENGAGKSTLMKILSGACLPDAGRMHLNGHAYAPAGPQAARTAGVAMIYQELNLAPDLSVEDNIMLGQERSVFGRLQRREQHRIVQTTLDRLGHGDLPLHRPVRSFSMGIQQLVEIARALVNDARVLVLDEPTSSLTQQDAQRLFSIIRELKEQGIGIVYISHFLEEVREVCDCYAVLRDGASVAAGDLSDVSDERIVSQMVGRDGTDLFPMTPHQPGEVLFSLEALSGRRTPDAVSFELRRGEILGIAGLVGSGRTELLRCLFGLDPVVQGSVKLANVTLRPSTKRCIRAGLGFVSEDRKGEGLAQDRSISDNITYTRLSPYSRWGWLNLKRRRQACHAWIDRLQIKLRSPDQPIRELSGGNQQKVALARVLHQQADVFLLDEPTRGIDVATKSQIYRLMGEQAACGKAILFVSSYLPELLAVCDRVGVMSRGRLHAIRDTGDWTQETIMATALGSSD